MAFLKKMFNLKNHSPYEIQSMIISILGFVVVVGALYLTNEQLKANTSILDIATNQDIMSHTMDVDKLFIDSPDLRVYFFNKKDITSEDENYNKALAIADYQLDFFDAFLTQSSHSSSFQDKETRETWDSYMDNSFKNSPVMCKELKIVSDKKEYTTDFINRFAKYCPKEFAQKA